MSEPTFDELWSDVVPVPQEDGPEPVAKIAYAPQCKEIQPHTSYSQNTQIKSITFLLIDFQSLPCSRSINGYLSCYFSERGV
jgi:hypothetical protein